MGKRIDIMYLRILSVIDIMYSIDRTLDRLRGCRYRCSIDIKNLQQQVGQIQGPVETLDPTDDQVAIQRRLVPLEDFVTKDGKFHLYPDKICPKCGNKDGFSTRSHICYNPWAMIYPQCGMPGAPCPTVCIMRRMHDPAAFQQELQRQRQQESKRVPPRLSFF